MRVVVALGGNALLRRGQELNAENQRNNIRMAAQQLARIHTDHELVVAHGNGPQVGLLALMDAAYTAVDPYPLDVLGAETVGQIGYMIEQELGNIIPYEDNIVTILTQILVDQSDPAFLNPTKPVGPVYDKAQADKLHQEKGWTMAPDGGHFRRVVPSPLPMKIIEMNVIRTLVDNGFVVICAGGGGIPVAYDENRKLFGVEAVIDKDLASALLARGLDADMFAMLTDVPYVYADFGTEKQKAIKAVHPDTLEKLDFASGSMGPKVKGACWFVRETGNMIAKGRLSDLSKVIYCNTGTMISREEESIKFEE